MLNTCKYHLENNFKTKSFVLCTEEILLKHFLPLAVSLYRNWAYIKGLLNVPMYV